MSAPPIPLDVAPLAGRLDDRLALAAPCSHVLATTGKSLRSRVVLAAADAAGQSQDRGSREHAAAAVELFHLATLAHDDVVDDGTVRRGRPTASAAFGNGLAGFTGAWLFARSIELVAECGDACVELFAGAAADVCAGEMVEVEDLFNVDRSVERYYSAVRGKTAALFAVAARLGGSVGGGDDELVSALGACGEAMGIAFQLADDIRDLTASLEETGKTPGADLRQGVFTLPVIHALEVDSGLRELLSEDLEAETIDEAVARVQDAGGVERAQAEARRFRDDALTAVDRLPHAAAHRTAELRWVLLEALGDVNATPGGAT